MLPLFIFNVPPLFIYTPYAEPPVLYTPGASVLNVSVLNPIFIVPLVVLYIPLVDPLTLPLAIVTVTVYTLFIPEPLVEIIAPPVEVSFTVSVPLLVIALVFAVLQVIVLPFKSKVMVLVLGITTHSAVLFTI